MKTETLDFMLEVLHHKNVLNPGMRILNAVVRRLAGRGIRFENLVLNSQLQLEGGSIVVKQFFTLRGLT